MSKIDRVSIPLTLETEQNWKLVRPVDGFTRYSRDVMWLEWNEEGHFKDRHSDPEVGRSLLMSPFNESFTWQTSRYRRYWSRKIITLSLKLRIARTNCGRSKRKDEQR